MQISSLDIKVIDTPVQSFSGRKRGDLTYGPGNDIDFDEYLKGKDYQQIIVFAPISDFPATAASNWYGLGGIRYVYEGRPIYYCIINHTIVVGKPSVEIYGKIYDTRLGVVTHEMLHSIERNSILRGWAGFEALHDHEKNGYVHSYERQWLDWQSDLMQDNIKNAGEKEFIPESFYVTHYPE